MSDVKRSLPLLLFPFAPFALLACSSHPRDAASSAGAEALLGNPDGSDSADHGCNVILRDVHTNSNRGGVETDCDPSGTCWVVWSGTVDVSNEAIAESASAFVTYQSGTDPTWYEVPAVAVAGGVLGFERYAFRLTRHTVALGAPYPTIQLVPYIRTGSRIFDHNRNGGPFDNYVLDSGDAWAIAADGTCPGGHPNGLATAAFQVGWTDALSGSLVQDGKLTMQYDLARLPQCLNSTYNGLPAWDTLAFARFSPSGALVKKSVRGLEDASGHFASALFTTDVPPDATAVALWFYTSGETCTAAWDSDYGQNYTFGVSASP